MTGKGPARAPRGSENSKLSFEILRTGQGSGVLRYARSIGSLKA